MLTRTNLVLSLVFVFIVIIGIAIFFLSGSSVKDGVKKFSIDYNNLEILAESHPRGDSILATIRENEQFLFDDDENNDIGAYLFIGFNVRQLGDDKLSISAYKEVLKIDEDHFLALNNIAVSYTEIGEYKKAEEIGKEHISIKYLGAGSYNVVVNAKDYKEAEKLLKESSDKAIQYVNENDGEGLFVRVEA